MKKQNIYNILQFFLLFAITLMSCESNPKITPDPFEHLKDEKVQNLISKTIESTGGLDNWNKIESLNFKKYFALYDADGKIENEVNQVHNYFLNPTQEINIHWTKNNQNHHLQSKNNIVKKTIDNQPDSNAKETSLVNTIRSATFVMSIPFNLLDPGVAFEYQGIDTLENTTPVEVLQATYNPESYNNHSTKDIWWLYFNQKTNLLEGYMVQHADHFSYVKNTAVEKVEGFTFPKVRKSWRVTKDREILYLRADYTYSDYELNCKTCNFTISQNESGTSYKVLSSENPKPVLISNKSKKKMNSYIQTPTPNLKQSLDFYKKLNFSVLSEANPTIVSDGKMLIEINPDRVARAGVKLYRKDWKATVEELKKLTPVTSIDQGYLLSDPSGSRIYLMERATEVTFDLSGLDQATVGNAAGVSLETTDIDKSIAIYEILGFSKIMGDIKQGFVVYQNEDEFAVSLMLANSCPHLFFNPSLTYFNGKNNLEIIENIRKSGVPITEEITTFNKEGIVDNIIIRDPGGYGFFIFSD